MATYCPTHGDDYIMPCAACAAIERVRLMREANTKNELPAEAVADLKVDKPLITAVDKWASYPEHHIVVVPEETTVVRRQPMQPIEITPTLPSSTGEAMKFNFPTTLKPGDPGPETDFIKLARSYDYAVSELKRHEEECNWLDMERDHIGEVIKDARKIVAHAKADLENALKGSSDGQQKN